MDVDENKKGFDPPKDQAGCVSDAPEGDPTAADTAAYNRLYSDGAFRRLFKDKEKFIELYNAIRDTNYSPDTAATDTTLSNVIYMTRKNDVSFLIDGRFVVFVEHQSTINRNIALRLLVYAAKTYELMTDAEDIYGPKKIALPRPEFYVLYNGTGKMPEKHTTYLSELFEEGIGNFRPPLDLAVTIYNINIGNNPELLAKSQTLLHYETMVELVRELAKTNDRGTAITLAIEECFRRGILTDFLKIHGREAIMGILTEYDEDKVRTLWEDHGAEMEREKAAQDKESMAAAMKAKGMDANTIAEITGFTVDKILRL